MKRFLKPLHHSLVFWYGVISLAFCLIWGNHLLHMESYNNAGGWMVWGLCFNQSSIKAYFGEGRTAEPGLL